ncbi:MAG: amino acid permease [Vampirovibrionales bacterium]|nr:amino acid permease [Vampirovibrionales bacterium]
MPSHSTSAPADDLRPTLGLPSAAAVVAGSMIGSGIFLVTPDVARHTGSTGMTLLIWAGTGAFTALGAWSYGKLAGAYPVAGGQYAFLREAWGRIPAFLYGWVFFWVLQTGTLAAVAVAFARYAGVLLPAVNSAPIGPLGLSTEKLLSIACLVGLTFYNTRGIQYGAALQNVFTVLKTLALLGLIACGLMAGGGLLWQSGAHDWTLALPHASGDGAWLAALTTLAAATVGPLFASDSWNTVTFIGAEVKNPRQTLPKALALGTGLVVTLYFLANLAYVNTLTLPQIQSAPDDKVAALMMTTIFGPAGAAAMAAIILVSTFGCLNGILLSGARVFYAMARDGLLFQRFAATHPTTHSPNTSLWAQCGWACALALSGTYGQLLGYIIFTALAFYALTIGGLFRLARRDTGAAHFTGFMDKAMAGLYIAGASALALLLLVSPDQRQASLAGIGFTLLGLPAYALWRRFAHKKAAVIE